MYIYVEVGAFKFDTEVLKKIGDGGRGGGGDRGEVVGSLMIYSSVKYQDYLHYG